MSCELAMALLRNSIVFQIPMPLIELFQEAIANIEQKLFNFFRNFTLIRNLATNHHALLLYCS